MKQYQITFAVPDDFVPEEMELQAGYGSEPGTIQLVEEGFVEPDSMNVDETWEKLKTLVQDKVNILVDNIPENAVVRITFPANIVSDDESSLLSLNALKNAVESTYKCPCICYTDSIDAMVENADQAIDMLNKMIAKIKTRYAVKDTSGIVIPK